MGNKKASVFTRAILLRGRDLPTTLISPSRDSVAEPRLTVPPTGVTSFRPSNPDSTEAVLLLPRTITKPTLCSVSFIVAGAGFEPATSWLCLPTTTFVASTRCRIRGLDCPFFRKRGSPPTSLYTLLDSYRVLARDCLGKISARGFPEFDE